MNQETVASAKESATTSPNGGGSLAGIGETFSADDYSGVAALEIPIYTSPARGFEPSLKLDYSSSSGNGPYGLGCTVNIPSFSRRTEKGIPRYRATDIFIYSKVGELVPQLIFSNGKSSINTSTQTFNSVVYTVTPYLPRNQGSFDLIEYWQSQSDPTNSFWKVTDAESTVSYYGTDELSRIANPNNLSQIFQWNIVTEEDRKGNKIQFNWEKENPQLIPPAIYNQGHNALSQRYLSSIQYANYLNAAVEQFAMQIVFDYGERNVSDTDLSQSNADPYTPVHPPQYRQDPFSSYHAGFEIRTQRLCRHILMFHQFEELGQAPVLVRRTSLTYNEAPLVSTLQRFSMTGCKPTSTGAYELLSEAPIDFYFSASDIPATPAFNQLISGNQPIQQTLQQNGFLPIDLYGEGLPGLLMGNNATLLYLEPRGDGRFEVPATVAEFPNIKNQADGLITVADLNSDGKKEIIVNSPDVSGFYEAWGDKNWESFRPFQQQPSIRNFQSLEAVDLSGSGKTDLVLVQQQNLQVYPSLGTLGFNAAQQQETPSDFPITIPGDQTSFVGFATLLGDGLMHRVRITSGCVECWPSLGYGQFGPKITLGNAPQWSADMTVNRVMLADIDGSGTSDLILVHTNSVAIYFNQSGNSFADPIFITLPDTFGSNDSISFADITGSGTTSIIFSRLTQEPVNYYYTFGASVTFPGSSFSSAHKPYLLSAIINNCGTLTELQYASSVKFYLLDKLNGTPWATRLPFPVQVVEQVKVTDRISGTCVVTNKRYHEGFYDSVQREFRGFGYIESQDTQSFSAFQGHLLRALPNAHTITPGEYVAPCYTREWFHNGSWMAADVVSKQYASQYYAGDTYAYNFPDSVLDPALLNGPAVSMQQAYQALSGSSLRKEVYEGDGHFNALGCPYTVEEANYYVRLCQAMGINPYAVFLSYELESINYNYDQNPLDPSTAQAFTLQVDDYGHVTENISIHLARRSNSITGQTAYPQQQIIQAVCQQSKINNTTTPFYLLGTTYESQSFQLYGLTPDQNEYFSYTAATQQTAACLANTLPYSANAPTVAAARLITWQRSYYWKNDLTDVLPLGEVESLGLHHHDSTTVFDDAFPASTYNNLLSTQTIQEGGYYPNLNYWWKDGLTSYYLNTPGTYYQVWQTQLSTPNADPTLLSCSQTSYDEPYYLHPVQLRQYLTADVYNEQSFLSDYVALMPKQQIDENQNITQSLYNPLGRSTVGTLFKIVNEAVQGGMLIYPYQTFPATYIPRTSASSGGPITLDDILSNSEYYLQGAISFNYDNPNAYWENQQPLFTIGLLNENYYSESLPFACKTNITYSDGLGRDIEYRIKAQPVLGNEQWMVSGITFYNNKGNPYKQYFPYFSASPQYKAPAIDSPADVVPPTCFYYDAINRIVRKDTPKGFFSKVMYSAWQEVRYDEDDMVLDSPYYIAFKANYPTNPTLAQQDENDALDKAAVFYNTPTTIVNDNAGNIIRTIKTRNNGTPLQQYRENDITGRELLTIDARLFEANQTQGKNYFSFAFVYTMDADTPSRTISADAGTGYVFGNIFDNQIWSYQANGITITLTYDGLKRQLTKIILPNGSNTPYTAEVFEYGEQLSNAVELNLRGRVYQVKDQSGVVTNNGFSKEGQLLSVTRALTVNYQQEPDWSGTVDLETETYTAVYTYNALSQLLTESYPDQSGVQRTYGIDGLLQTVTLVEAGGAATQEVITSILYVPNTQRAQVNYGNGVIKTFTYDPTTQYLVGMNANRPATNSAGQAQKSVLQDITYTYDPVGNLTRMRDDSWETVFNNNQQVDALSDYTYDAFYRLTNANGRQHPSINYNTYVNNANAGDVKQSKFFQISASGNDGNALENYTEVYTYDDSDNLTEINHQASSASWTRVMNIASDSNHIATVNESGTTTTSYNQPYDNAGNQQQLYLNNGVTLNWDYANRLTSTAIIERPSEPDDADYYTYNSGSQRVRKVSERLQNGASIISVNETIYLGAYKISQVRNSSTGPVAEDNRTLTIQDGDDLCLVYKHNVIASTAARLSRQTVPDQFRFQLGNLIGSLSYELDESAAILSYEEYFPYGGTSLIAGTSVTEVSEKEYRFSGKECDDSTGLYYFGARYYVSWLGRWLNTDPAGAVDGMNLYEYVGSNPLASVDADGQGKVHGGLQRKMDAKKQAAQKNKTIVPMKKAIKKKADKLQVSITERAKLIRAFSKGDEDAIVNTIASRAGRSLRVTSSRVNFTRRALIKENDREQVRFDQLLAPPGVGQPLPSTVNEATDYGLYGTSFFQNQMIVSKANLNTDDRDSTNVTMAKAYWGSGNLSASTYSGRDDSGPTRGGLGEAWCHLIAHCLGGAEASNNLVAGSQGSNLVQLGIERALLNFIGGENKTVLIRVGADVYKNASGQDTHVAQKFYYQILDSTGKDIIYSTNFQANILRADTIQSDKYYEAYNALATYFGTALKKTG